MIYCYYCSNRLVEYDDSGTGWLKCIDCNVMMQNDVKYSEYSLGLHLKWETEVNGNYWAVNIYPEKNITILSGYCEEDNYYFDEITINRILEVNKNNVENKVRTILTFQ